MIFFERMGLKPFPCAGYLWNAVGLRFYVPNPCCFPISLSSTDLNCMWEKGAFFVQHAVPDNEEGFPSYVFLIDDKNYDFPSIPSSDRRHNIRRAFKKCTVDRISVKTLRKEAPRLIADTYNRQGRNCGNTVLKVWEDYMVAAESNPLFSAWGTFVNNELAAAKTEFKYRGGMHPEGLFSRSDFLKYYSMEALLFVSSRETMKMDDVSYISHGIRPITEEKESLIRFKESMGLKKLTVKERFEVNPLMEPLFNRLVCKYGSCLTDKLCAKSEYLRLIKGISATINLQRSPVSHFQVTY